jgi:dihydroorotate dehydrogenase
MADLRTRYLGLELPSPLVASSSPLTGSLDGLRRLEAAGAGAVVLPSLSTGVHTTEDVLKVLLAGADVAMMTSALLRNGPDHLRPLDVGLREWMDRHGYETVDQLRGRLSQRSVPDPAAFERANYIKTLASHPASGARS